MRTNLDRKVSKLRRLVARADDISEPFQYFMDSLVSDPELMQSSRRGHIELGSALEALSRRHFGEPKTLRMLRFLIYDNFWHGQCFLGSCPTTLIYFTDVDIGVITICAGEKTDYYRFSIPRYSPRECIPSRTDKRASAKQLAMHSGKAPEELPNHASSPIPTRADP